MHKKLIISICGLALAAQVSFAQVTHDAVPVFVPTPQEDEPEEFGSLHHEQAQHFDIYGGRASNLYRIVDRAIEQATDPTIRQNNAAHAGVSTYGGKTTKEYVEAEEECVWFCNPTLFVEYNYINTSDDRRLGSDADTHSFMIGGDFSTVWDLLIGGIYTYTDQDLNSSGARSDSDIESHYFALYLAKTFMNFLNVGVVGTYGTTDIHTQQRNPSDSFNSDIDTWSVSPFVGASHTWGAFSAGLNATYMWADSQNNSERFATTLTLSYAVTEQLVLSTSARYNIVTDSPNLQGPLTEDDDWLTVGGKISYRITDMVTLYAGYEYDALMEHLENHSARGGISLTF
jgi:opacity protein-like surface antigen